MGNAVLVLVIGYWSGKLLLLSSASAREGYLLNNSISHSLEQHVDETRARHEEMYCLASPAKYKPLRKHVSVGCRHTN